MKSIPYAKELGNKSETDKLRERIAEEIIVAAEKERKLCSLEIKNRLPKEIVEELRKKGYKFDITGIPNFYTLYIYWK